ncbi:XrtA/PEP-CTERM system TPR-repeat protein PrsT [Vibrio sp. PNB22_8_1]|uniref:XrtA/PEP-CTERM system TPR-repeat protein PrsT n=1 Tax=unclassified Vibrio TaxID=2614977 RepID=UPI00406A25E8
MPRYIMSYEMDFVPNRLALVGLTIATLFFSKEGFANKYIDSAKVYLSKNETNAAMIELKNAIQKSPEDGLARFMIGKIYLEQGYYANAEKELSRAIKYGHNIDESLPLLARSLLNQNKSDEVVLLLEEFELSDSPSSSDILAIAAMAEIRLSNLDSAKMLIDQAGQETVYAKLAHATYLTASNEKDLAYQEVKQLLASENSNSDIWKLKGHIELAKKEFDKAYDSYTHWYKISPGAKQYALFFMANALVHADRFTEAKPMVKQLLKINNQVPQVNELEAMILYSEKDYATAKVHADRALNNGSSSLGASTISGVSAYQLGQYEQAHRIFTKIAPQLPANHLVHRLYSTTQLKLGYFDEAIESLNNYEIKSPEDSRFVSQASLELAKVGKHQSALKLAQKASVNNNSQAEATVGLIKLSNNDASGVENLQSALHSDPSLEDAKQGLINYYLAHAQWDEADAIADNWLANQSDDISALMVKGLVSKEKGQLDAAKSYFNQVRKINPNNVQSIVEIAAIEFDTGNTENALALLIEAKKQMPSNHKVNGRFIDYSHQMKRLPDALVLLDEQIEADPFNRHLKIQKANALSLSGNEQAAIHLLEALPSVDKDATVWKLLGGLYLSLGERSEAKKSYLNWISAEPYNPSPYIQSIHLASNDNDIKESLKLTKKAQKIFPNNILFPLIEVELRIKKGDLKSATRKINTLPDEVQKTPHVLRLQGLIYIAKEDYNAAVEVQKKRYELLPNLQTAKELTAIYQLSGQTQRAIDFLNSVIDEHGESAAPLKLKLAELHIESTPNKAIEQYEDIITKHPTNAIALNNLAWLYLDKNQTDTACKYAQKAHEVASQSYQIADTYGYCLLKSGNISKALELLELAYNRNQQSAEVALHFAEALLSDQQLEQAGDVLSKIVTKDPQLVAAKSELESQVSRSGQ